MFTVALTTTVYCLFHKRLPAFRFKSAVHMIGKRQLCIYYSDNIPLLIARHGAS